ncbi:hypothetical protein [Bifidobacterium dentium]|uniref:hypothetical protein n=1 Tax=Bifidobacterium dentium TaxID=1689 RepID=UPI0018C25D6E|nr:hypothetical protein [Bifidobacterium dentium]MBF9708108.1 hypothetical protein [Bifidobacterium dentium]
MNDEQFEWESSTKQAWGMFRRMLEKRADTRGGILGHRHQNVGKNKPISGTLFST